MSVPSATQSLNTTQQGDISIANVTQGEGGKRERKPFVPLNSQLKISVKQKPAVCMGRARTILEAFKTIEISALGEATPTAVRVAENLTRHEDVEITKIETETFSEAQGEQNRAAHSRKKIKITIHLKWVGPKAIKSSTVSARQ
jgi:hypothetical protein